MVLPNVGLVIDEPYISQILAGDKTWEMRGSRTGKREVIGLIKKSTKHVFGTAELYACEGPLSYEQLLVATNKHGISKEKVEAGLLDKWNYAWKLKNVVEFETPIPYNHPNGAVTWVKLNNHAQQANKPNNVSPKAQQILVEKTLSKQQSVNTFHTSTSAEKTDVPVAKDGTFFSPELARNGYFTVGEKGDEQKFRSFEDALHYLRNMNKAKWRRPNDKGNWGIVSAVEWR